MKTFKCNYLKLVLVTVSILFFSLSQMQAQRTKSISDDFESTLMKLNKLKSLEKLLSAQRSSYDYASYGAQEMHGNNAGHFGGMNYYTGTYRSSIELTSGVSISYSNNGIAVDQVATWVGLGWNLSAGGKITRNVKGYPDDINLHTYQNDKYYHFLGWNNIDDDLQSPSEKVHLLPTSANDDNGSNNLEYFISNKGEYENDDPHYGMLNFYKHDSEPDLFYFAFPGATGSFVFSHEDISEQDSRKQIKPITYSDLKITYEKSTEPNDYNAIINFTVEDRNGVTYYFDQRELVSTNSGIYYDDPAREPLLDLTYPSFQSGTFSNISSMESGYAQSWYLSKIVFPDNSEIIFEYNDEHIALEHDYYESFRNYDLDDQGTPVTKIVRNFDFEEGYSDAVLKAKRLSKIYGDDFEIEFIANTLREDLKTDGIDADKLPKALDKIRVYSKLGENKNIEKQIDFKYSYFNSGYDDASGEYENKGYGIYHVYDYLYGDYIHKRLKLDEVSIYNGNQLLPPYKFDYVTHEDDDDDEYWLPARHSYCKDIYGYYKEYSLYNKIESLIPEINVYKYRTGQFRFLPYVLDDLTLGTSSEYTLEGANRLPNDETIDDGNDIAIGMLQRIDYPTGMFTEFEYEQNDFIIDNIEGNTFKGGGVRLSKITNGGDNIPESFTEYIYKTETDLSSGKLITMPQFGHLDPINLDCETVLSAPANNYVTWDEEEFNQYYVRGTSNENDMSEGVFGYSRVEEVSDGVGGKTVYTFVNEASYNDYDPLNILYPDYEKSSTFTTPSRLDYSMLYLPDNDIVPYVIDDIGLDFENGSYTFQPNTNYSWHRGKLLSKEVFDAYDNKITSDDNTYNFFFGSETEAEIVYGLKNGFLRNNVPPIDGNCGNTGDYIYLYEPLTVSCKYGIHTGVDSYVSTINKSYEPETGHQINETEYFEHNDYGLLSLESYTDDQGNTTTTEYIYVCDLWDLDTEIPNEIDIEGADALGFFNLIKNNRYSMLVQSKSYKEISGDNNKYLTHVSYNTYKSIDLGLGESLEVLSQTFSLKTPGLLGSSLTDPVISINGNNKYEIVFDQINFDLRTTFSINNEKGYFEEILIEKGNPMAVIYASDKRTTVFEASNSVLNEIDYEGFEDYEESAWSFSSGSTVPETKSGEKVLSLNQNESISRTFYINYDNTSNGYRVSVWVKGSGTVNLSFNVNNSQITKSAESSGSTNWELLNLDITRDELKQLLGQQVAILVKAENTTATNMTIDDIVFAPDDAVYNAFVYDNRLRLTSGFDANNYYTSFVYDDFSRLLYVKDNEGYIVKTNEYFVGDPCDFVYYPINTLETVIKVGEPILFVANVKKATDAEFVFGIGGSTSSVDSNGFASHTFSTEGVYTITLSMTLNGIAYIKAQDVKVLPN